MKIGIVDRQGGDKAMSKDLRVNADELRVAADQLDMHAADLRHDHATAHANMTSAVPRSAQHRQPRH